MNIVLLNGPPGAGKSTVARALADHWTAAPWGVLDGIHRWRPFNLDHPGRIPFALAHIDFAIRAYWAYLQIDHLVIATIVDSPALMQGIEKIVAQDNHRLSTIFLTARPDVLKARVAARRAADTSNSLKFGGREPSFYVERIDALVSVFERAPWKGDHVVDTSDVPFDCVASELVDIALGDFVRESEQPPCSFGSWART